MRGQKKPPHLSRPGLFCAGIIVHVQIVLVHTLPRSTGDQRGSCRFAASALAAIAVQAYPPYPALSVSAKITIFGMCHLKGCLDLSNSLGLLKDPPALFGGFAGRGEDPDAAVRGCLRGHARYPEEGCHPGRTAQPVCWGDT